MLIELTDQHRVTLAIIGKLTDDRNAKIQKLAGLKMGYKDLVVAVADGSRPQGDLDSCRAEMQRLAWIIENEPVNQAVAVFHQKAQSITLGMEQLAHRDRLVAAEVKYRKDWNLLLENFNSVRHFEACEAEHRQPHFRDLLRFQELRGEWNNVSTETRLKGFIAYASDRGCGFYSENVTMENLNQPRAGL
jgi:hypothetical protein